MECGYLSNRGEGAEVSSAAYRDRLADKIAEAIVDYRYGSGVYHPVPATLAETSGGAVGTTFR